MKHWLIIRDKNGKELVKSDDDLPGAPLLDELLAILCVFEGYDINDLEVEELDENET